MDRKLIPPDQIEKALCEKSLFHFGKCAQEYVLAPEEQFDDQAWHIKAICTHLEAVSAGRIKRLIINLPPGVGKSRWICVLWQVWHWLKEPWTKWMMASYSQDFAKRDLGYSKDIIRSDWFQSHWGEKKQLGGETIAPVFRIREKHDTALYYGNDKNGSRVATSVGGGGTGARCHIAVGDDCLEITDADSKINREYVNQWTDTVLSGRGVDPRKYRIVIVQQRLHGMDQTGHLLATGGLKIDGGDWEHLYFPLVYEPWRKCRTSIGWEDPRQNEGEILWPLKFTQEVVEQQKKSYGHKWAPILQQRDVTEADGIPGTFSQKYFRYFKEVESGGRRFFIIPGEGDAKDRSFPQSECIWFQVADTAMKTGQEHDYTAVGTFAVTKENDFLVVDMVHEKLPVPMQFDFLISQRQRFPQATFMALEEKGSGVGLMQEGQLRGLPFRPIKATFDKRQRAGGISIRYMNLKVFHKAGANWIPWVEDELVNFGSLPHDEAVDLVAHADLLVQGDALLRHGFAGDPVLSPKIELDDYGNPIMPYDANRTAFTLKVAGLGDYEVVFDD